MGSHPIVHVEIASRDPKASGEFYQQLFGWKIQTSEEMNYVMWQPEGSTGGGFSPIDNQGVRPHDTIVYIGTDDIDATLSRVQSLGGKVLMPKTEIPTVGWFAIFEDPHGGRLALFTGTM
ncbi:MAG TPA: VOC family protein [Roseiflexaceae bacterium]|nr:VOC family protein [Roseiflexaceae bacterium]